tara:strand:- start:419 stop:661 length:243 start_codon:yes stop_codon:yes gene_type:complete
LFYEQYLKIFSLILVVMYNCKIYHDYESPIILLNINVPTLKELAKELDMTYQQVADLNSRKRETKYLKFKYCPKIEINKI